MLGEKVKLTCRAKTPGLCDMPTLVWNVWPTRRIGLATMLGRETVRVLSAWTGIATGRKRTRDRMTVNRMPTAGEPSLQGTGRKSQSRNGRSLASRINPFFCVSWVSPRTNCYLRDGRKLFRRTIVGGMKQDGALMSGSQEDIFSEGQLAVREM